MRYSHYHAWLRISSLVTAIVLLFVSGVIHPYTTELTSITGEYLSAAVGVGAAVEPNGVNQLTAKIAQYETDLAAKEREIAVLQGQSNDLLVSGKGIFSNQEVMTFLLSIVLFIMLVLIVLNYVLDYLHRADVQNSPKSAAS